MKSGMQCAPRLIRQFRHRFCQAGIATHRFGSGQRPAASIAAAAHAQAEVQRKLRHILLPVSESQKLDEIQQHIEDGADFASMAEEHSICPSRMQGGSMGWNDPAMMSPVLAEAAFQADIGELVQAESRHGLHLMHVEAERQAPEMRQMSVQELSALLNDPAAREDTQFIDVREPEEHRLAALPLFELQPLSRLNELRGHADQLDKGKHTVLLCHHGVRSAQAAAILQKYHDFTTVSNVVGGIDRFSVEVDSGVPRSDDPAYFAGLHSKQQPNQKLLDIVDANLRQLAVSEERLMEKHAEWLGAHPPGHRPDLSHKRAAELVQPELQGLPHWTQLDEVLYQRPAAKLPVHRKAMAALSAGSGLDVLCELDNGSHLDLAAAITAALCAKVRPGMTCRLMDKLFIELLVEGLDELLPAQQRVGVMVLCDPGDTDSTMTHGGKSLRPDGQLRSGDGQKLLFKWEERPAGVPLVEAVEDLRRKMAAWSPLYYGELPYLLTAAAAGTQFQFFAFKHDDVSWPHPIGPRLDLNLAADRAEAVIAMFNLYRLLRAVRDLLPDHVLPEDLVQRVEHRLGYTRTLCFKSDVTVHKTIEKWSLFSAAWGVDLAELQEVYRLTAGCAGLVHMVQGPGVSEEDTYGVHLKPVGRQRWHAKPRTEQEAASAAHGLLHGLAALHKAGFVHRDLRWDNTACSFDRRYFLLDLELCGRPGRSAFTLETWPTDIVQAGDAYTEASDILILGNMLRTLDVVRSPEGHAFLQQLQPSARSQAVPTAEELLCNAWISCIGDTCKSAGAQPNVR